MNNHFWDELPRLLRLGSGPTICQTLLMISITTNVLLVATFFGTLASALAKSLNRKVSARPQRPLEVGMSKVQGFGDELQQRRVPTAITQTVPPPEESSHFQPEEFPDDRGDILLNHSTWYCVGASVAGVSHKDTNTPCQDYTLYRHLPSGELLIAVADGAGSAQYSAEAAQIACNVALNYVQYQMTEYTHCLSEDYELFIYTAFEQARSAIIDVAKARRISVKQFATTLTVVILTPQLTIGGMVGDGMAIVEYATGNYACLFELPKREYANQMVPITSSRALEVLQIAIAPAPIQSVSIVTDGMLSICCDLRSVKPYPPFFKMMMALLDKVTDHESAKKELEILLDHPLINEKTEDDKTLVMAKAIKLVERDTKQLDCESSDPIGVGEARQDDDFRSERQGVYSGAEIT